MDMRSSTGRPCGQCECRSTASSWPRRVTAASRATMSPARKAPWHAMVANTCSKFSSARRKESPSATRCKTSRQQGLGIHLFQQVGHRAQKYGARPEALDLGSQVRPALPASPLRVPPQSQSRPVRWEWERAGAGEPRLAVDAPRAVVSNMILSCAACWSTRTNSAGPSHTRIGPPELAYVIESTEEAPGLGLAGRRQRPRSRSMGWKRAGFSPSPGDRGSADEKDSLPVPRPLRRKRMLGPSLRATRSGARCRHGWATPPATAHAPPPGPPHAGPLRRPPAAARSAPSSFCG